MYSPRPLDNFLLFRIQLIKIIYLWYGIRIYKYTCSIPALVPVNTGQLTAHLSSGLLQAQSGDDLATRVDVFDEVFLVFVGLGTIVGIIVTAYLLHKAYKYRAGNGEDEADIERPTLGELPSGADKGGKKLFLSFALSAIIVISLIGWTYGLLLYVETGMAEQPEEETVDVEVIGFSFGWDFVYHDDDRIPADEAEALIEEHGEQAVLEALRDDDLESLDEGVDTNLETTNEMTIPTDRPVMIEATAPESDVWHNFGIPELRVKADAMPGETTETWFIAEEEGTYLAECFELCGVGHSVMEADVHAVSEEEFQDWYDDQTVDKEELIQELEEQVEEDA